MESNVKYTQGSRKKSVDSPMTVKTQYTITCGVTGSAMQRGHFQPHVLVLKET